MLQRAGPSYLIMIVTSMMGFLVSPNLTRVGVCTHNYLCKHIPKAVNTLEYGINVQVVINKQVGYFLQNNKRTGLNKRTGGNLINKNFTLDGKF